MSNFFFVEMYRLSIVIGVIIVVLLASPVPCVRGKPPECWGVIPGVVSCDCSIIGFMANYGFNKLEARILTHVPLAHNVRREPQRAQMLWHKFDLGRRWLTSLKSNNVKRV